MQLYVLGFVDDAHATTAEFFDDAVVRRCFGRSWAAQKGNGAPMVRTMEGEVNENSGCMLAAQVRHTCVTASFVSFGSD